MSKPTHANGLIIFFANAAMLIATGYSALRSSPAFDEPAHFAGGVILAEQGDAGYFRVNPPLGRWITACAAAVFFDLKLPPLEHSAEHENSLRPEFPAGESVIAMNQDIYMHSLQIARLARLPFLLLGSWLLWKVTSSLSSTRRMLCVVFWCTSPLILGHGWMLSADALSGVAVCLILWFTARLWRKPTMKTFLFGGVVWGLAVGTKFTLGPLALLYPILVHVCAPRDWSTTWGMRPGGSHRKEDTIGMNRWKERIARSLILVRNWGGLAFIALLTVNSLYLFDNVGIPLGKHDFVSQSFSKWTTPNLADDSTRSWLKQCVSKVPSPFPKVLLEGVDRQLADMDRAHGAYLMGQRIQGPIHWFFLVGYFLKEQLAVWLSLGVIVARVLWQWVRRPQSTEKSGDSSLVLFCLLYLSGFALLMANQSNLVWNIRYLIPALPMIYIILAARVPRIERPLRWLNPSVREDLLPYGLTGIAFLEFVIAFPFFFSYINPVVGGPYRVPMALNDSNFDYGQDLFYVRDWVEKKKTLLTQEKPLATYGLVSGQGEVWLGDWLKPADFQVLQSLFDRFQTENEGNREKLASSTVLVVSRGLGHGEPWALRDSTFQHLNTLLSERVHFAQLLLEHPPDEFITPTIGVYYVADRH
jgi:hypothetical protein